LDAATLLMMTLICLKEYGVRGKRAEDERSTDEEIHFVDVGYAGGGGRRLRNSTPVERENKSMQRDE